jgi:hypothetical protein
MSGGRMGGELDPYTTAAIRAVANPENWRGLSASQKADLQAEIDKNLTKEQRRTVAALIKKGRK